MWGKELKKTSKFKIRTACPQIRTASSSKQISKEFFFTKFYYVLTNFRTKCF